MQDALASTEEAMKLLGRDGTVNEPRRRMPLPSSSLQMLAGPMQSRHVKAFGRDATRRAEFSARMSEKLKIPVEAAASAQACVAGAAIVVAATKSPTPVIEGAWLSPGAHVTGMGANSSSRSELDEATVLAASVIATDDVAQSRIEAGEFVSLTRDGRLSWDRVSQLSDIVQGTRPGRTSPADITLFKSLGLGIEDVALAAIVYERAIARGVGRRIDL